MNDKATRVGVGVFIFRDNKFLMFKRRGSHGAGAWSIPGGHLEFGESFEETAVREVKEETGLAIKNIRFGAVTNDYFKEEGKHYVTIWVLSDWLRGKETITEPDKSSDLAWHTFNDLPEPLFLPWQELLKSQFMENIQEQLG
jgi:8-oxo-dGTP diphosphatase